MIHIPVLQKEVLLCLDPRPNENFIDCTVGEGGHSAAILKQTGPAGKVLGIEKDPEVYGRLKSRIKEFPSNRLLLARDSYINLKEIAMREKFGTVSGILFDLGMSSWHLEESGRGFSFLKNEPLDMRYGKGAKSEGQEEELTAEKIINQSPPEKIQKILEEYGEEKFAARIARRIVAERKIKPIKTTFELAEIVKKTVPSGYRHRRIHCATRTFQAIRIAVNKELDNLKAALPRALETLPSGGRLAVISFHSLEDRIVKRFLKEKALENKFKLITKKPIVPLKEEIKINPRSRSARLRAAVKICPEQINT